MISQLSATRAITGTGKILITPITICGMAQNAAVTGAVTVRTTMGVMKVGTVVTTMAATKAGIVATTMGVMKAGTAVTTMAATKAMIMTVTKEQ